VKIRGGLIAISDKLNRMEIPQKIYLCHEAWDSDTAHGPGLLTETKKLKRKQIAKHFEKEINELYSSK